MITLSLSDKLPIHILNSSQALVFRWMAEKLPCCVLQYGFFDDKVGPVVLCVLIMICLSIIYVLAILKYVKG